MRTFDWRRYGGNETKRKIQLTPIEYIACDDSRDGASDGHVQRPQQDLMPLVLLRQPTVRLTFPFLGLWRRIYTLQWRNIIVMTSQITGNRVVCLLTYSGWGQRNTRSVLLAVGDEHHRWPKDSPHKVSNSESDFIYDVIVGQIIGYQLIGDIGIATIDNWQFSFLS